MFESDAARLTFALVAGAVPAAAFVSLIALSSTEPPQALNIYAPQPQVALELPVLDHIVVTPQGAYVQYPDGARVALDPAPGGRLAAAQPAVRPN